jgi:hypothetical protein
MYMEHAQTRRTTRLLGASILAAGLAFVACSNSDQSQSSTPTTPTAVGTYQTITITPTGITPSLTYIAPGYPLLIVNNDTRLHRLHLNAGVTQPGCAAFDNAGDVPAGESRLTGVIGDTPGGCSYHDHLSHGDLRFAAQLLPDASGS